MEATFAKTSTGGYTTSTMPGPVPTLAHVSAPGDVYLPRDLARFVIEKEFGIRHGTFGHLATAHNGGNTPPQRGRSQRSRRASHRHAHDTRADVARSERLLGLCLPLWQARAGHAPTKAAYLDMTVATPFDVDRVLHHLDTTAQRWAALAPGESITLDWPAELATAVASDHR